MTINLYFKELNCVNYWRKWGHRYLPNSKQYILFFFLSLVSFSSEEILISAYYGVQIHILNHHIKTKTGAMKNTTKTTFPDLYFCSHAWKFRLNKKTRKALSNWNLFFFIWSNVHARNFLVLTSLFAFFWPMTMKN